MNERPQRKRFLGVIFLVVSCCLAACQPVKDATNTPALTQQPTAVPPTPSPIPTSTPGITAEFTTQTPTPKPETPTPTPERTPTPTPQPTPQPPIQIWPPVSLPGPVYPAPIMHQIGGQITTVSVVGTTAYVGVGPRLYVLDVTNPAEIQAVGASGILPGVIQELIVADGVAYVATGRAGVWLIDVSDPSNPVPLSSIATNYKDQIIAIYENYLLVVDQQGGYREDVFAELQVIDVQDKHNPVQQFRMDLPDLAHGLAFYENYLYLSTGQNVVGNEPALLILETITLPELKTAAYLTDMRVARGILIYESILYFPTGSEVISYDLSDPLNPVEVETFRSFFPFSENPVRTENALLMIANFCDVDACASSLSIFPLNLPVDQSEHVRARLGYLTYDLTVNGDYVYAAVGSQLVILDVSYITAPRRVGTWSGSGYLEILAEDDGWLYALNQAEEIFTIFSLETAAQPTVFQQQKVTYFINSLTFSDDYIYWGDFFEGIIIADKDALEPLTSILSVPFGIGYGTKNVVYHDGLAFALTNYQLMVVDVSDPDEPLLLHPAEWQPDVDGPYSYITWQEPFLYAAAGQRLVVLDTADPRQPAEIGSLEIGASICNLIVDGDYAYTITGACNEYQDESGELVIVNISDPANMRVVGSLPLSGLMLDIVIVGDYAFIANGDVLLVNIQNPAQPESWGMVLTPGQASNLAAVDNLVYVADGGGGLLVIGTP